MALQPNGITLPHVAPQPNETRVSPGDPKGFPGGTWWSLVLLHMFPPPLVMYMYGALVTIRACMAVARH